MKAKKTPYWFCNYCETKIVKVGKGLDKAIREHSEACPNATYSIKRL